MSIISFLATIAAGVDLVSSLAGDLTEPIADITTPIEEIAFSVVFSQCKPVKRILGVEYDQIKEGDEPDLSRLTLNFISRSVNITYKLSEAARLIPQSKGFDPNKPLKVFIHGFTENPKKPSFTTINEAFSAINDCNILALDASSLIRYFYLRSTTFIRFIGAKLGEVMAAMMRYDMKPMIMHLIGHSLGAHIASFAGKNFTALTGAKVGRISGLDPAGPCFSQVEPDLRLKASDAVFVDVIHTNGGVLGMRETIGHADFFPNDGRRQPKCLLPQCSHSRSWVYYAESIVRPNAFLAVQCQDWESFKKGQCANKLTVMGYYCSPDTRGMFYLQTAGTSPYGLGEAGVHLSR